MVAVVPVRELLELGAEPLDDTDELEIDAVCALSASTCARRSVRRVSSCVIVSWLEASFAEVAAGTPSTVVLAVELDAAGAVVGGSVESAHDVVAPNTPAAIGATSSVGSQRNCFLVAIVALLVIVIVVIIVVVFLVARLRQLRRDGRWCYARVPLSALAT